MPATVALVHLRLNVVQASSLKDKRRVIKSFKDRVRHAHNVSIAEIGELDSHRWCEMAFAMVGNDRAYIEGAIQIIINAAAGHRDMLLAETTIEWL